MTIYGEERPTSYFSTPAEQLDPDLFQGRALQSWVRQGVLSVLHGFLQQSYRHSELWAHPWLAGSGVSYQWSAERSPKDLDCLIGIDFPQFRKANPEYRGLTDKEIADELNGDLREGLWSQTSDWNGFELTFFALTTSDIRTIKPYAAYDLKYNEWTVTPSPKQTSPAKPEWESVVNGDYQLAHQINTRFGQALSEIKNAHPGPARRNIEARLNAAGQQGMALYDEIHGNRSEAFSPTGSGYEDFHNYRWQAGKRSGTIDLLHEVKSHMEDYQTRTQQALYGVELPDTSTLIRRAALYGNK